MEQQAYILRISPSGIDQMSEALSSEQIIIGWSNAAGLLDTKLSWEEFREIIRNEYYKNEASLRKAGAAAGHMWRFIREMNKGDLVVAPYGSDFYVAEVIGSATYNKDKMTDDTAYRRSVKWLADKKPIPRSLAKSALISRMKIQGTCASASDLIEEIKECVNLLKLGEKPTFQTDLQKRLVKAALDELRDGRMESFGFENLIKDILLGLGAEDARVIPRSQDKGADIVATFLVAGAFRQVVSVQAKHWQPEPPVDLDVVNQLISGIEVESADLGMIITSGTISDEAVKAAEKFYEEKGIRIEMVDGEQFSKLLVEHGISTS